MDIVSLDVNLLILEKGSYQNQIRDDVRLVGQQFNVSLPGYNKAFDFRVDKLNTNKFGVDTYVGHINDNYKHFFVFTVKDDVLTGSINIDQNLFIINSHHNKRDLSYSLTWYDQRYFDKSHNLNDTLQTDQGEKHSFKQNVVDLSYTKAFNDYHFVGTLFYFGSDVSDPYQLASNIINRMNLALYNSGIPENYFFTTNEIVILNSDFGTKCREQILPDMNAGDNEFSNIFNKRIATKSDISISVAKGDVPVQCYLPNPYQGRIGGQAELGLKSNMPNTTLTDNWALADDTAVHEIGHVLNGLHEKQDDTVSDPKPTHNNQAIVTRFTDLNAEFEGEQSIMGGYRENWCSTQYSSNPINQTCPRVLSFSNQRPINDYVDFPRKFSDGTFIGALDRNNATYFTQIAIPTVSDYRTDPLSPSAAPSLSITSQQCYGFNDLNWTNVSNATFYITQKSSSSAFPSHKMIYRGVDNQLIINATPITRYYRVLACNSGGCGPSSNVVASSYVNYCM